MFKTLPALVRIKPVDFASLTSDLRLFQTLLKLSMIGSRRLKLLPLFFKTIIGNRLTLFKDLPKFVENSRRQFRIRLNVDSFRRDKNFSRLVFGSSKFIRNSVALFCVYFLETPGYCSRLLQTFWRFCKIFRFWLLVFEAFSIKTFSLERAIASIALLLFSRPTNLPQRERILLEVAARPRALEHWILEFPKTRNLVRFWCEPSQSRPYSTRLLWRIRGGVQKRTVNETDDRQKQRTYNLITRAHGGHSGR